MNEFVQEILFLKSFFENPNQYIVLPDDPKDEYGNKIKTWTRDFNEDGVEADIAKFVTKELENSHGAIMVLESILFL